MKRALIFMSILIGLFFTAIPVSTVAVDKDTGYSFVLPVDQSPVNVCIESPALIKLSDLVASPVLLGVEKPANNYFIDTESSINESLCNTAIAIIGYNVSEPSCIRQSYNEQSNGSISANLNIQGTGLSRLDIGDRFSQGRVMSRHT